jgi:hypothetical protein
LNGSEVAPGYESAPAHAAKTLCRRRKLVNITHALAALAAVMAAAETHAQLLPVEPVVSVQQLPELARFKPFNSTPMAHRTLAGRRGGDGVLNQNRLKGVVADNSASHLTTGSNTISEGAFAGASGLPMVIQNSGNNVLIQNSTIVNVQIK